MTPVKAIKAFFERPDAISPNGGRQVRLDEMKGLSTEERNELGKLACEQLGEMFEPLN